MNQGASLAEMTQNNRRLLSFKTYNPCFFFFFRAAVVVPGTREAAFVHALSSAAVAVAVTRACTRGELERCGCDRKVRGVSPEGELDLCWKISPL